MATDNLTPTVASNVRDAMKAAGETYSSMERATGISRARLRLRCTGNSPWTTTEMVLVAAHLGLDADALLVAQVAA